jgi:O-acetyl-ADP-ribose deacetylase (regulator of RNase III)
MNTALSTNNNAVTRTFTTSVGKVNTISLVKGDIARVKAQALFAPINSGGMWFGAIDGVIQRNAGGQFHNQVRLPKKHGDVIVARKQTAHRGDFEDVIFIIDDLEGPVSDLVYNILKAASDAGYTNGSLPAFRTGVMKGAYEPTVKDAVAGTFEGIQRFYEENPDSNFSNLIFVIYDSPEVLSLLKTTPLEDPATNQIQAPKQRQISA